MRLSTTLQLAIAPMAFARYGRFRRTNHLDAGMEAEVPVEHAPPAEHVAPPAEHAAPPAEHVVAPPAEHVAPPAEHVAPPAEHVAPPAEHIDAGAIDGHAGLVSGVHAIVIWVNEGAGAEASTVNEQVTVTQTITVAEGGHATEVPALDGHHTTIEAGATGVVENMGATHSVEVGGEQGLSFFPQEVEAKVGDMIIFTFYAQNHTVTQSSFDKPCSLLEGGMDSGFIPNPDDSIDPAPQVAMQVMTEDPIWMYCAQGNHCGQGMVFSINPSAEKTHAQFQANAIAQEGDGDATGITDGDGAAPPEDSEEAAPSEGGEEAAPTEDGAVLPTDASEPIDGAVNGGVVMGVGTIAEDGSCQCAVMCGAGSFPNAGQGVNSFGGMPGSISMGTVGGGEGDASPSEDASADPSSAIDAGETGGDEAAEETPAESDGAEETPDESDDTSAEETPAEESAPADDTSEAPVESGGEESADDAAESPAVTPPAPVTPPARR